MGGELRFGLCTDQNLPWPTLVERWQYFESLGFDSLWDCDHLIQPSRPDGPYLEGWTLLAALASETTRAQVGCLVLAVGYRNPALVAAMAATLDHVVGGRLILGLGAGWYERDYAEYGYRFGAAGERQRDLERAIGVIRSRWATVPPRPTHGTVPILVGGDGEKVTLRIVAQHADLWNGFGPPRDWVRRNQALDAWCDRVGRDSRAIERTAYVTARDVPRLHEYVEAGATHLIFGLGSPFDTTLIARILAWRDRARRAGPRS